MSSTKSFLVILRTAFVLFTLQFVKDAFYRWDGYSYYMTFREFLPDLSLSFLLWTIPGILIAVVLWVSSICIAMAIKKLRLEHVTAVFVITLCFLLVKHSFFRWSFAKVPLAVIVLAGIVTAAFIVWFLRKRIQKLLDEINSRLTPLVWIFAFLFIIALPLSIPSVLRTEPPNADNVPAQSTRKATDIQRPNIILVTWDTATALNMGMYGYSRPTTPFLSEWAKEAVVFNRAYSSANWTIPAVMSLMTGQRVSTHKVWYEAYNFPVPDYAENLPDVLRDNGYSVYGFVQSNFAHPNTLGFGKSFIVKDKANSFFAHPKGSVHHSDFFRKRRIVLSFMRMYPFIPVDDIYARISLIGVEETGHNVSAEGDKPFRVTPFPPELAYDRFLDYLPSSDQKKSGDTVQEPFFAWIHVYPPHAPYMPPEPFLGMFGDAEELKLPKYWASLDEYGPEEKSQVEIKRNRYDELIVYSDDRLRTFMTELSKRIDLSSTVIIFSADHGESFSHGHQGHGGPHMYEAFVNIPLIIKMPVQTNGSVIDMIVEQTDIAPTILDIAGIAVPAWMEGRSLLPLIQGKSLDARPAYSIQFIRNRSFGHPITKGTIAVWEGDYKLIYYIEDKKTLLFNTRTDPGELQNLSQTEPEIRKRFVTFVEEYLDRINNENARSGS